MRFRRSEGLTPSERVLSELCDRSFLKLWTYPNLFKKPSKELTDLLVVFGRDVIIFSDKSCAFPDSGDAGVDWSRWYRKSIAKSAHQIDQAERWFRNYPGEAYLDARCTTRLPVALPTAGDMRIHRICVALNATERARIAHMPFLRRVFEREPGEFVCLLIGKLTSRRGASTRIRQ